MSTVLRLDTSTVTAADAIFADRGRAGPVSQRHTITTDALGAAFKAPPAAMRPPWIVESYTVQGVDAAAKTVAVRNLGFFDSYMPGISDGAELLVFNVSPEGISEGVTTRVRETRIRHVTAVTGKGFVPAGAAREVRFSPPSYTRGSAPYHFAVASIDAEGNRSAWVAAMPVASAARPGTPRGGSSDMPDTASRAFPTPPGGPVDPVDAPEAPLSLPGAVTASTANEGRQFVVRWDAAASEGEVAGYVVTFSYDGAFAPLSELVVEDTTGIAVGDFIYLRLRATGDKRRDELLSPRVDGTYMLSEFGLDVGDLKIAFKGDRPGIDWSWRDVDGDGHLDFRVAPGRSYHWWVARHYGLAGEDAFYPPIKPDTDYVLTLRGRAVGAPARLTVTWDTVDGARSTLEVGTEWGDHTVSIRTPDRLAEDRHVKFVKVWFEGGDDGAAFEIESLTCGEARYAEAPTNPTDEQLAEMRACRPRYNRFHLVKGRPYGIMPRDFMSLAGQHNRKGLSLPQVLRWIQACNADLAPEEMAEKGMSPWLQPPAYWSAAEYGHLAEYLCTPYDPLVDTPEAKPWAYLRYAQGQAEPWQTVFPEFMIEVGNEPWNFSGGFYNYLDLDRFDTGGGRLNAFMLDRVAAVFEAHPDVDPARWRWYLNLWVAGGSYRAKTGFNYTSLKHSEHVTHAGYAAYIGGWDVTSATLGPDEAGFRSVLTDPYGPSDPADRTGSGPGRATMADRMVRDAEAWSADRGRPLVPEMYEQGPGYQPNPSDRSLVRPQEEVMKGLATGTGFLGGMLLIASRGVAGQNFFTYKASTGFSSHASELLGGAPSGAWQWFAWANRWAVGETVALDLELTDGLKGSDGRDAGRAMSAFRVTAKGHVTYAAFNFDPERARRIVIPKPATVAGPVTRWEMTGEVSTTNASLETAGAMRIVPVAEPAGYGATAIDAVIGAGKCVAWVYDAPGAAR